MIGLYNNYKTNTYNKTWKVAIYARLSREDEKDERYKGQSGSIENQINFLKSIIKKEDWFLYDIYIDDGYTGTNFDRPGFVSMIKEIENDKINMVITKDLSRLGRDYIETGRYLERYFPEKRVRYIAVNDNIDTFDKSNSNNDMTPFKAVFNDMYAKDISNKVRTSIYSKARNGDCIKSFLPYGYKKEQIDKNKILVDRVVSDNVKLIFDLYLKGNSKAEICRELNNSGIITPLAHKKETTNYFNPNFEKMSTYKWNSTIITKILKDRIYTGDLVQLKYRKISYKVKKFEKLDEKEYVVIPNNHEGIIERNKFDLVQEMLLKKTNEWTYNKGNRHLLTGLVYCTCEARISYVKNKKKEFKCVCSSYKRYGNKFCTNSHLKEKELLDLVKNSVNDHINTYFNISEVKLNEVETKKRDFTNEIKQLEFKKSSIIDLIAKLYDDRLENLISGDTFSVLTKKYEKQKEEIVKQIEMLNNEKNKKHDNKNIERKKFEEIVEDVIRIDEINENNKSLIFKLIDKITIKDRDIKILYKFGCIN